MGRLSDVLPRATSARPTPPGDLPCGTCGRSLAGRSAYGIAGEARCLRCALLERPLLRRSALTSLVVGTVLLAINQGEVLVAGDGPADLRWKVPLTYLVPFCVATWSALSNGRRRA